MASSFPNPSPPLAPPTPKPSPFRNLQAVKAAPPTPSKPAIELLEISSGPRLVVAIDFGSNRSGYAWQFRTDFERDRLDIHINTKWPEGGLCCYKTLTALLLKPDQSVAEFGFRADKRFSTIKEEESDWENWYFFRGFKMMLYANANSLDAKTTMEDANGRHLPASLVFGKSIQFIKEHAIQSLKEAGVPYIEDHTKWVITIPAIWNDRAKGLMRKSAADVAGIPADNLTIALEPECAVIYCIQLIRQQLEIDGDLGKLQYIAAPDSVLMLVDMGGDTVDITTVRVGERGQMEQLQMSGGGPWGGMRINEKFFILLRELIGQDVLDKFVTENEMDYFDLRMDFETQKREVKHPSDSDSSPRFRLRIPDSLKTLWERKTNKTLSDIMKQDHMREKDIKFASSRLSIPIKIIHEMFDEGVQEILNFTNKIIVSHKVKGLPITAVIAVGGFAMSSYVMKALRQELGGKNIPVVRPPITELAVLLGAVLFGQQEDIITSRIMPYTYGVSCTMAFNAARHSAEHRFEDGGRLWANNSFRKHVTRGQAVKRGEWIVDKDYFPECDDQTSATIYVFASDKTDPIHTTDEGCQFVGQFDVEFPRTVAKPMARKAVTVAMRFGGTELEVKATSNDGKTCKKKLKF
ncbi:heat shock 70 kDa protein 12B-like [Dreissena polymorpha]|uniref:heat shock 70 kDa protein 12B-like n=1 Tax=Dreissena polymorpha TaxID=45954 RepID=UPI002263C4F8|nr:heat shock 70 kDa protein 12B-like [Dreissena polymorpha]